MRLINRLLVIVYI